MMLLKLKTINTFVFSVLTVLLIESCQEPVKNNTDKLGNSLKTEALVDNQSGVLDSSLNYCFYLPKNYNGIDKLPVVFFLDPHASGALPLSTYAGLANKYGYIFVASNDIKNGQSASLCLQTFQSLVSETKRRFIVDENRMFAAGFSGGAKLAILFTQQMPEIIGVAACGASLPFATDHQPNYYYAGIVGNQDFNFLETNQTFVFFDKKGLDYTSEIFNGGHQWPPAESFEMAIVGFEIYSMKIKRMEMNNAWLDGIWSKMNDSIALFAERQQPVQQNIYLSQTIRWFYGLKNINDLNKQADQIRSNIGFLNAVKKQQKLIQTEVKLRSEFIRAIELRDTAWWTLEIGRIKKSIQQNDKEVAQVSQRLLNYLSMASFMLIKTDLEDSRLDNAIKKLAIYGLIDSENPDVYLMYAHYYMQSEDLELMNNNFKKAQTLGIRDYDTYKNDPFWKELFKMVKI